MSLQNINNLKINQAAKFLGVSAKTLRRWETSGILSPKRSTGNQRVYPLELLVDFKRLRSRSKRKYARAVREIQTVLNTPKASKTVEKPIDGFEITRQQKFVLRGAFLALAGFALIVGLERFGVFSFRSALENENKLGSKLVNVKERASHAFNYIVSPFISKDKAIDQNIAFKRDENGKVLGIEDLQDAQFDVTIPSNFSQNVVIEGDLTAPNITYTVTAGDGIEVTGGQNPLISLADDAVNGFGTITVGTNNIEAEGNDTLTFAAGSNVSLSVDTTTNKVTISSTDTDTNTSGWTDAGSNIELTTAGDTVTIGSSLIIEDGGLIDLSAVLHDDSTAQGFKLPQNTSLTDLAAGEGFLAYDSDDDLVKVFNGTSWTSISGASTTLQEAYGNDTNGSDVIIAQTSADDSLIIRNPAASGTDSAYVLSVEQLAAGAIDTLNITNSGSGAGINLNASTLINIGNAGTDFTSSGGLNLFGDLAVNGGNITTNQSTFSLAATTTTLNLGTTSATTVSIGSTSGTTTVNNALTVANGKTFTANGIANLGDGGDAVTISGTTLGITSNGAGNDITLTAADDFIFDDAQLSSSITLTATDTAFDSGDTGIVDAINSAYGAATGGGGGLWSLSSNVISPTTTTHDFSVGGSSLASSIFSIDESAGTFLFGGDQSANPTLTFEATDNDTANLGFNTNDSFYFTGANVGIEDTSPDAKLEVISTTEQLRLTYTDDTVDSRFTVDSSGNLTIDNTGTLTTIADGFAVTGDSTLTGDLAINGDDLSSDGNLLVAATGYVRIGDSGTPGSANADDDLYVLSDIELDGQLYIDGIGAGTVTNAVCINSSNQIITCTGGGTGSGDITSVTAGSGLTGGGASGDVTLDIGSSSTITVGADAISVTADSIGDTELTFNTGQHLTTSSSPTFVDIILTGGDITGANGAALDLGEAVSGDISVTGDLIVADNSFIGLGSSAGLIEFDDQTTDEVNILNANVGIGTSTPSEKLHSFYTDTVGNDSTQSTLLGELWLTVNDTAGAGQNANALQGRARYYGTSGMTATSLRGYRGTVTNMNDGTIAEAMGGFTTVLSQGAGGVITNAIGLKTEVTASSGTNTNATGLYVGAVTGSTNNYGLFIETPTSATNNFAIYSSGATNYFGGNVGIADTTPDAKLEVISTTEQLRLTYDDNTVDSRFTVDSSGDLTIDNTGTQTIIADDLDVNGGDLTLGQNGADGTLTIYNELGGTDYSVVFQPSSSQAETTTYTLPVNDGTDDYVLTTNGSGVLAWEAVTSVGGAGDITSVVADAGLTGGASSGDATLAVGAGNGITVNADDVAVNQAYAFTWTGLHSWTSSLTDTSSVQDVNLTLVNDAGADIISAINVDLTSTTTGADGDILYGINLNNIASADTDVTETGIRLGEDYDNFLEVEGTTNDTVETFLVFADPTTSDKTITFPDDTGTVCLTSGNCAGVGGNGDITAVTAGSGLTGGGASGDVTLNVGEGTAIDINADDIAFDSTEVGDTTWGSGSGFTWTFNAGATDPTLAFASDQITATAATLTVSGDIDMADDNWIGLSGSAGLIEFDDQATDEINILNANVGIGTSTPQSTLQINAATASDSSLYLSDGDIAHGMTTQAPTDVYGQLYSSSSTIGGLVVRGFTDTDSASVFPLTLVGGWGTTDPTNSSPAVNLVASKKSGTTTAAIDAVETAIRFDNFSTALMTILGSGNVGIGTTAPDATLEINHATGDSLRLTYNDADGSAINYTDFSLASDGDLTIDSSGNNLNIADDTTFTGDIAVNGDDISSDGNLLIAATGYVRIGDSGTPGSANGDDDLYILSDLEVDGQVYLDGITTGTDAGVVCTDSTNKLVTCTTSGIGDITAVTAGNGLTGGGTSGAVTLDIGSSSTITVGADAISVTADSIGDTELAFNTGQHLTTTSTPTFGGLTLNGNLDMTDDLILNIGASGTDFTAGGGLTLAEALVVNDDASFVLGAGEKVLIDAATTDSTGTAGALDIDVDTTSSQSAIDVDLETITDSGVDTNSGIKVTATATSTDADVIYGIQVANLGGTPTAGNEYGIYQAGTAWDYGLYIEDAAHLNSTLAIAGATTHTVVNAAGGSANSVTLSGTLGAFDGSDTFRGLYLNYTNADHAGATNVFNGLDIGNITGDGQATETAISIGTGWDSILSYNGTPIINGSGQVISTSINGTLFSTDSDSASANTIIQGDTLTINGTSTGIDVTHSGDTITVGLDTTEIGTTTWGSGSSLVWTFNAGTVDPTIDFNDGAIVLNEAGSDIDFRAEGDNDANLLFVNAGSDTIGIGTSAPDAKLEINHATGDNLRLTYNDSNGSATAYTDFSLASDGDLTIESAGNNVNLGTNDIFTIPGVEGSTVLAVTAGDAAISDGSLSVTDDDNAAGFVLTNNTISTYGAGSNTAGLAEISSTSLTTGKLLNINTGTADALTTGTLLNVFSESTGLTTGALANFDWSPSPSATATGDLVKIKIGTQGDLATGANLFNILSDTTSLFSVSETAVTSSLPVAFNATGDVSVAYDLVFTNQTASYIKSNAPLYLEAGETFENNNLTLRTYGTGDVVVDLTGAGGAFTIDGASTDNTSTTGVFDLNVDSITTSNVGLQIDYISQSGGSAAGDQFAQRVFLTQNDTDADLHGISVTANAVSTTIAGTNLYDCLVCLVNEENQAAAVQNAIYINSIGATSGAITNAINIADDDVTNDLVMQNGEIIDNNVNGDITFTQGAVTFTFDLDATDPGITTSDTNLDINEELIIELDGGATTTAALCGNQAAGDQADTSNVKISDCSGTPVSDYMEMYSVETGIEYGDIVAPSDTYVTSTDGITMPKLTKTNSAYQKSTIGIASDKSGAGDFNSIGYNVRAEDNPWPVALSGRLPVKVSQTSSPIRKGDYITTSFEIGKAMKAEYAGQMIGKALEDWNPGTSQNTVLVFVTTSWADPNTELVFDVNGNLIASTSSYSSASEAEYATEIADLEQRVSSLEIAPGNGFDQLQSSIDLLTSRVDFLESEIENLKNASSSGNIIYEATTSATLNSLVVLEDAVLPDTVINGKLDIGTLSFDNIENSINAIGTLKFQDLGLGSIEFQGGKIIMDQAGNLVVSEGVIKGNDNFRGSAQIEVDEYEVQVLGAWDEAPATINVTPSYRTQVWVTDITDSGFTINVSSSPTVEQEVFWTAIW